MKTLQKVNTIIFDFDGTLADTFPLVYHSFKIIYKEFLGKDMRTEEIIATFGPTEPNIIDTHFSKYDTEKVKNKYFEIYKTNHNEMVKPKKEIHELLDYLKNKGIKLGIMTGKSMRSLKISLELMELDNHFDILVSGDDTKRPKPDPEGLYIALKDLNANPEETIFIGDSNVDIEAGKKANIQTIGIKWFEGPDNSFEITPDAFFSDVEGLKKYLKNRI